MPVAAYDILLGSLNLTLPSAREPLAFSPRRCMTRGCEEDRCSPLGAGTLLYPPPRCLWYGVEVSATNSTRRSLPPLGLVSKSYCLTPLSDL